MFRETPESILPMEAPESPIGTLLSLADRNTASVKQLEEIVRKMGGYIIVLDTRMKQMEQLLSSSLTVTGAQANALSSATKGRAQELCERYRLSFKESGTTIRNAILKELKSLHSVSNIHDIPQARFSESLQYIAEWDSYLLVRKLREKERGMHA